METIKMDSEVRSDRIKKSIKFASLSQKKSFWKGTALKFVLILKKKTDNLVID